METPPPPFAPPTPGGDAAAAETSSPGMQQKKEGAPWRRGREAPGDPAAEDTPVWKAEDFPSLNPQQQDDFPPLDRSMTPRRSLSRRRSGSRFDTISEENTQSQRGAVTPKRTPRGGCIPEDRPRVHLSSMASSLPNISEDKPQMPRGLMQNPPSRMPGLMQKSCPSLLPQRQLPAQQHQNQQQQLPTAWQQRRPREAKSVEPEARQPVSVERKEQPAGPAKSVVPETRRAISVEPQRLPTPEEPSDRSPKDQPGESVPNARQTSENRCHSEPVHPASQDFEAASAQAAKIAQVHRGVRSTMQNLFKVADHVKASGRLDPQVLATFEGEHSKMVQLIQQLEGTAGKDTSALVALNLLLVAGQGQASSGTNSTPGTAPVAEHVKPKPVGFQPFSDPVGEFARRASFLPTPLRSPAACSFVPVFIPQMQAMAGGAAVANMWVPTGVVQAPSVMEYRAPSVQPREYKKRPAKKYNVINPSTGEKMVIKCAVPFRWRPSRRLRIVDPKTGAEVLPQEPTIPEEWFHKSGAPALDEKPLPRTSDASSRLSNGTTCSRPPRRSSLEPSGGRRTSRTSIAGRALYDGRSWALEPASGGHWDWPLSRQEKKDRVLMLSQLELLEEIEDLKAAAYPERRLSTCSEQEFD